MSESISELRAAAKARLNRGRDERMEREAIERMVAAGELGAASDARKKIAEARRDERLARLTTPAKEVGDD